MVGKIGRAAARRDLFIPSGGVGRIVEDVAAEGCLPGVHFSCALRQPRMMTAIGATSL